MKDIISFDDFLGGRNDGTPSQITVLIESEKLAKLLGSIEPHIVIASNSKGLGIPEAMSAIARARDAHLTRRVLRLSSPSWMPGPSGSELVVFEVSGDAVDSLSKALNESFGWVAQKPIAIVKTVQAGLGDTYVSKLRTMGIDSIDVKATMLAYTKPDGRKSYLFINS